MLKRSYYRGRDFRHASTIEELRGVARRHVPRFTMEYVEGGAENEVTLARNRTAFDEVGLIPRTLVDVGARDLSVELFGVRQPSPW